MKLTERLDLRSHRWANSDSREKPLGFLLKISDDQQKVFGGRDFFPWTIFLSIWRSWRP